MPENQVYQLLLSRLENSEDAVQKENKDKDDVSIPVLIVCVTASAITSLIVSYIILL